MLQIRETRAEDGPELRRIRLESLLDSPEAFATTHAATLALSESEWRQRAAGSTPLKYFVAFDGAEAIGLVAGVSASGAYELISMWVHPRHRGAGIAKRLVTSVVQHGHENGHACIALVVSSTNSRAIRCYQQCGFALTAGGTSPPDRPEIILQRMERSAGNPHDRP